MTKLKNKFLLNLNQLTFWVKFLKLNFSAFKPNFESVFSDLQSTWYLL